MNAPRDIGKEIQRDDWWWHLGIERKTFRVWLRWSSEWAGDRVEEGVPGTQKARR